MIISYRLTYKQEQRIYLIGPPILYSIVIMTSNVLGEVFVTVAW